MNNAIRSVGVLISLCLATGTARADLISGSFSGISSFTGEDHFGGIPVSGSFTYQPGGTGDIQGSGTYFSDVSGSLSVTAAGHTYLSNKISALLMTNALELIGGDEGILITLAARDLTPIFSSTAHLPSRLDPSVLPGSTYSVSGPGEGAVFLFGPITQLDIVSTASEAPEPGALTLTGLALLAGALWRVRPRTG